MEKFEDSILLDPSSFKDEGKGYDPKNEGSFLKLEKARTLILSHSL